MSWFFYLRLSPPPSPIPRKTTCVPAPSLQTGGVFHVAPMPSTAGSSRTFIWLASPFPPVRRATALPPVPNRTTSWPGAVPITRASSVLVEVTAAARHGTDYNILIKKVLKMDGFYNLAPKTDNNTTRITWQQFRQQSKYIILK